ncbi:hypothetical protein AA0114_g12005 [Alternaria tenuissima]|uniref:Dienelactone hydrolase domain-containing protein n=1 Tax=Alternaria tenuissima TaxID=119927 RepID=A0A4Q4M2R1_9PLEO|nr:hypothetical protein AA0114_g12005 [Alternaria tenuissima]
MTIKLARACAFALATSTLAFAWKEPVSLFPSVISEGQPKGEIKNISGIEMYHTYPDHRSKTNSSNAILFISDIFGIPLLQNKLLADSYARAGYLTVIPDLFAGDAIPSDIPESQLNLTAWFPNHQPANVEPVIEKTIAYLRDDLGIQTIGAVGYCFGGRYVARFLAEGKGVDLGFTAHPSVLSNAEIAQIVNPISIAAGELDATFNITQRYDADRLLTGNNVTYEQTLYSGAPHGFGVRVNANIPRQKYAKQSAYIQALKWFDFWL